jgi:pimeloyl-ACP methyl ester carboxylesterase
LHAEAYGEGKETFVFLHGLLGSSRNWRSIAKELQTDFRIYCLDLRNHGSSFHHPDASIEVMSEDLLCFLDYHEISNANICGHSLGGKVAMRFSCDHSSRVEKLIIADIAPRVYPAEHHIPTLDALLGLELSSVHSRKDADDRLSELIPNWAFGSFYSRIWFRKRVDLCGNLTLVFYDNLLKEFHPIHYKQVINLNSQLFLFMEVSQDIYARSIFLK